MTCTQPKVGRYIFQAKYGVPKLVLGIPRKKMFEGPVPRQAGGRASAKRRTRTLTKHAHKEGDRRAGNEREQISSVTKGSLLSPYPKGKNNEQQEHGAQTRQTQTHTQKKDRRARATSENKSPTKREGHLLSSWSSDKALTVVVVCSASDKPPTYGDYKHPAADVVS